MFNNYERSLVGENCAEYNSRYAFYNMVKTNLARNCEECLNFKNGKCTKDLFSELYETLRMN